MPATLSWRVACARRAAQLLAEGYQGDFSPSPSALLKNQS